MSDALSHSLIGTSETTPLVPGGPTTEPQPSSQFPQKRPLLLVRYFFFLKDRLFTPHQETSFSFTLLDPLMKALRS
jgi:hypothetical protein